MLLVKRLKDVATHSRGDAKAETAHSRLGPGEPCLDLAWTAPAHCSEALWSQHEAWPCCFGPWEQLQTRKEAEWAGVWEASACCGVAD